MRKEGHLSDIHPERFRREWAPSFLHLSTRLACLQASKPGERAAIVRFAFRARDVDACGRESIDIVLRKTSLHKGKVLSAYIHCHCKLRNADTHFDLVRAVHIYESARETAPRNEYTIF